MGFETWIGLLITIAAAVVAMVNAQGFPARHRDQYAPTANYLSRAASFSSRISRCRIDILSMLRVISRTFQGNGLRSSIFPSLSTSTNMNPRGRILSLSGERAAGSVSVSTIPSR